MTAQEIQSCVDKLERALSRGELRVQFADRQVDYKSTGALIEAITYFKSQLAQTNGRRKQAFGVTVSGF